MWKIHGPTYLNSFLEDQVGIRVASRVLLIFQNGFLALLLLVLIFVPWIFLILPGVKNTVLKVWKENPQFFLFAVLWGLAILGMGALTSKFYERYLLPVAPVLAVWIAWLGVRGGYFDRLRSIKIALPFFLVPVLLLTCFSFWLNFGQESPFWLRFQWLGGVVFLGYAGITWFRAPKKLPKIIAYSFLIIFFLLSSITYPVSLPHQGQQANLVISKKPINGPIAFYGNLHVGTKIRMSLGPNYDLIDLPREHWQSKAEAFNYLILEDKFLVGVDTSRFDLTLLSRNWESRAISKLLMAYHSEEFEPLLEANSKKYFLLRKK
jgi:hypothetical protein